MYVGSFIFVGGETRLVAGRPDVDTLAIFIFRLKPVIVDAAVLDGVFENLRIDNVVFQPNAFSAGIVYAVKPVERMISQRMGHFNSCLCFEVSLYILRWRLRKPIRIPPRRQQKITQLIFLSP